MSEKEETVKVTVTVELPKNVHRVLEGFEAFAGISLEELLLDQLEPDIGGLYQNGMFQRWIKDVIKKHGCAGYFRVGC